VLATEKVAIGFQTVTDDMATARVASWRHCLNGTFEAVKGHHATSHRHLKGLIVIVAASLTFGHWIASLINFAGLQAHTADIS
jgi:hypothetical protein